jgi:hypothetical protein
MKKTGLKPTLEPININSQLWYYENKKSIELYSSKEFKGRIQARTLLKSLSRIYGVDFASVLKKKGKHNAD